MDTYESMIAVVQEIERKNNLISLGSLVPRGTSDSDSSRKNNLISLGST